jgi:hypothetical protein
MTDSEFLKFLKLQIASLRSKYKLTEGKAFAMWFCLENLQLDEPEAYEAASLDGGNDKDIDLFWVDDETERVTIAAPRRRGQCQNGACVMFQNHSRWRGWCFGIGYIKGSRIRRPKNENF